LIYLYQFIGKAKQYAQMTADEASQCDVAVLRKYYPHTQRGFDKWNRPLLFERYMNIILYPYRDC